MKFGCFMVNIYESSSDTFDIGYYHLKVKVTVGL